MAGPLEFWQLELPENDDMKVRTVLIDNLVGMGTSYECGLPGESGQRCVWMLCSLP